MIFDRGDGCDNQSNTAYDGLPPSAGQITAAKSEPLLGVNFTSSPVVRSSTV